MGVLGNPIEGSLGYSCRRANHGLCWYCSEGETDGTSTQGPAITGSSRPNQQRTKLPTFSSNEREHKPACLMVVVDSNSHSPCHGGLADETSQEIFRSQKTCLTSETVDKRYFSAMFFFSLLSFSVLPYS